MKVYLLQDIERVGIAGEIISVKPGYAKNFLVPRKLGVLITSANEPFYNTKAKKVVDRKTVIESKSSILAEKIKSMKALTIKRKMHDDGKLYGSLNASEVVEALAAHEIKASKSQVVFAKPIKEKGTYDVTIKLSNKIQATLTVKVVAE